MLRAPALQARSTKECRLDSAAADQLRGRWFGVCGWRYSWLRHSAVTFSLVEPDQFLATGLSQVDGTLLHLEHLTVK